MPCLRRVALGAVMMLGAIGCGEDAGQRTGEVDLSSPPDFARPVAVPDVRFKLVGAFEAFNVNATLLLCADIGWNAAGNEALAPVEFGGQGCWQVARLIPQVTTEGMIGIAANGHVDRLESDVAAILGRHEVITSLDRYQQNYGISTLAPKNPADRYQSDGVQRMERAALDAFAASEGAAGRVITAVAPWDDQLRVVSFSRSTDPSPVEARVIDATEDGLEAAAKALAADGYVLTALGHADAGGFVLVGTRRPGAIAPRSVQVVAFSEADLAKALPAAVASGAAIVGMYLDAKLIHHLLVER